MRSGMHMLYFSHVGVAATCWLPRCHKLLPVHVCKPPTHIYTSLSHRSDDQHCRGSSCRQCNLYQAQGCFQTCKSPFSPAPPPLYTRCSRCTKLSMPSMHSSQSGYPSCLAHKSYFPRQPSRSCLGRTTSSCTRCACSNNHIAPGFAKRCEFEKIHWTTASRI